MLIFDFSIFLESVGLRYNQTHSEHPSTFKIAQNIFYPFPRVGVSADCPGGVAWTHVTSDVLFQGVSYLL